jgi:PHP family Zn ribbon phosphoesterase
MECSLCNKDMTTKEVELYDVNCEECAITLACKGIAHHLREAHITFEEVIRKIMEEVDR